MSTHKTLNTAASRGAEVDAGLRAHMNRVYGLMSVGLLLTFATAWAFGTSEALSAYLYHPETGDPTMLAWIAMFAPLAMVFGMAAMVRKASAPAVQTFFYVFSAVMGISLSSIFITFTGVSIAQVFLLTAIAFAGLSLWGYTTGKDLSGWGSFLLMGLIGLIGAMIINLFIGSSALDFAISVIGVGIFAGLTAYDTQKIKSDYIQHADHMDEEWLSKSATMGALELYLDFLNLFLLLMNLLGDSD